MWTPTENILLIMSWASVQTTVIINLNRSSLNPSMTLRTINPKTRLTQRLTNIRKNHAKPFFQNNPNTLNYTSSIHLQLIHIKPLHLPRINNNRRLKPQIQNHTNRAKPNTKLNPITRLPKLTPIKPHIFPLKHLKLAGMILQQHRQPNEVVTPREKF